MILSPNLFPLLYYYNNYNIIINIYGENNVITMTIEYRAATYRLYPSKSQEEALLHSLDGTRKVYNRLVEICRSYVNHKLPLPSMFDLINMVTKIRHRNSYCEGIHSQCFCAVADRVHKAFLSWMKRHSDGVGFPRFKSWKMFDSYTYTGNGQFGFKGKNGENNKHERIRLSKIGLIKYSNPFIIKGNCKTATVYRRHIGNHYEWYVSIAYTVDGLSKDTFFFEPSLCKKDAGLDLGLDNLVAISDGTIIPNDHTYKLKEKQLTNAQKKLSLCEDNTLVQLKQKTKLAHKFKKLREYRKDLFHKITRELSVHYKNIVMEDLSVKKMTEDSPKQLKKSYRDAAWGIFTKMTCYKVAETGGNVIFVDPAYTSQLCSACGSMVPKDLSTRVHECPHFGLKLSRDVNAAINILNRGLRLQTETGICLKCNDESNDSERRISHLAHSKKV